ncbi:MAG: hypothetical protein AABX63_05175 [Nanoarchaeota archaeon]
MRIKSLSHLKELLKGREQLDCFILLNSNARSSKTLLPHEDGSLTIFNEIDSSEINLASVEKLQTTKKSNIFEAIQKGSFFVYDYEIKKGGDAK